MTLSASNSSYGSMASILTQTDMSSLQSSGSETGEITSPGDSELSSPRDSELSPPGYSELFPPGYSELPSYGAVVAHRDRESRSTGASVTLTSRGETYEIYNSCKNGVVIGFKCFMAMGLTCCYVTVLIGVSVGSYYCYKSI